LTPKAQVTKEKKQILDFKNLCVSKDTLKKVKKQHGEWKKICANHIFGKDLISKIYKELL